jgi:hypothetical protein
MTTNKNQNERHVKILCITPAVAIRSMFSGDWVRCLEPQPKDARVVNSYYNIVTDQWELAIEHSSFPALKDGSMADRFSPRFETDTERAQLRETAMNAGWKVERHSGRLGDHYREVFAGEETIARAKFEKIEKALRQGGVRLIRPDGHTEYIVNAPRLRTRW